MLTQIRKIDIRKSSNTDGTNISGFENTYLDSFPMVTSPITDADGATKLISDTFGAIPLTATNLVLGTSRSVYFVSSMVLPKPSSAVLLQEVFFMKLQAE